MRASKARRGLLGALALWALIELLSLGGLGLLDRAGLPFSPIPTRALTEAQQEGIRKILSGEAHYLAFSPTLGWTIRPGGAAGLSHADEAGRRVVASRARPQGARRVLAFGDSFTHGDEVEDGEAWPAQLDAISADLEVQNYGVPGYGPDQALLRYLETDGRADVVILGFMSADLARAVNTFPPFLEPRTALALPKPSVALDGDGLVWRPSGVDRVEALGALLETPEAALARLGAEDPYFQGGLRASRLDLLPSARLLRLAVAPRAPFAGVLGGQPYDPATTAFRATALVLERFQEGARARGASFGVLLLPGRGDLEALMAGGTPAYAPLQRELSARGISVFDAAEILAAPDLSDRFLAGGHYSALGNRLVAEATRAWLSGGLVP